jgi:hypothetical protein
MLFLTLAILVLGIFLISRIKTEKGLIAPKSYLTKLSNRPKSANY